METVLVKVYTYPELSNEAKHKAFKDTEQLFDIMSNQDIEANIKDKLDENGLSGLKEDINFNIDYSHHSGVAFYGDVNLKEFIDAQEIKATIPAFINVSVYPMGHQEMEFACNMAIESNLNDAEIGDVDDFNNEVITEATYDEIESILAELERTVNNLSSTLVSESFKIIENIYSEANMIEISEANEWRYLKDGEFFFVREDEKVKEEGK